ncbi:SRPBCC family protein [Kaistella montana]|uniref:SRPBCC domain-containing protein n=1 Tax=Kaistella montana TaxID=1849733 RepID=A0ABW5K9U1_9FLAO|nr:SRPBCC domain-containing protein [Kaistella montana]MCQ4035959.1 SRPBCC domain-containing protein [Kaistella montana]
MKSNIVFNKDFEAATVFVMATYKSTPALVWDYFTKQELLDQWWAPNPWRCETSNLDFRECGQWNYAMVGPDNERHRAGVIYEEINAPRSISWTDFFADENGNPTLEIPSVNWLIGFTGIEEGTKLTINIHFNSENDMKMILDMGFEEGFKMGLNQLAELINEKDRP